MRITTAFCDIHTSVQLVPAIVETRSSFGDVNRFETARCSNPRCHRNHTRDEGYFDVVVPGYLNYGHISRKPRCGWNHYAQCMVLTMLDGVLVWACPYEDCRVIKPYGGTSRLNLLPTCRAGNGPNSEHWTDFVQYKVIGLPAGEEAWINRNPDKTCTIVHAVDGVQTPQTRNYAELREALDVLIAEIPASATV